MPQTFADLGIDLRGHTHSQISTTCPRCSDARHKSTVRCLSVNLDDEVWKCHHCGWSGGLKTVEGSYIPPVKKPYRKPTYRETPLPQRIVTWFAERGIPEKVLARNRISYGMAYMPHVDKEVPTIQFPYFRAGELINCKYRDKDKHFCQAKDAERILYGLDDIAGDAVWIVEGELDKLALETVGILSCISVPDGAPAPGTANYASKFDFLRSAETQLAPLRKIVLAVDTDAPGEVLAQELARRLGPERCLRVIWSGGCKDANDVLMSHGPDVLRECLDAAQPWPVAGIVTVGQLSQSLQHIYEHGMERGHSTGWTNVDRYYTVRPSEMTIVSGIPSHGKSTWLSALMINLARRQSWRFAVFSPENYPLERYTASLLEQYTGLPFDGAASRMSLDQMQEAAAWLGEQVSYLLPDDAEPTLAHLLDLARVQVYRQGIKGLILDPWNEIDHSRPAGQTETEYISSALSQIRRFARLYGVHVWVVAHPTKLHKAETGAYAGQYPPPTPYDVSGSSHWRNKADNCVTIWRDLEDPKRPVEVHVQKVRFREIGQPGKVELVFEPQCGQYREPRLEDQVWAA